MTPTPTNEDKRPYTAPTAIVLGQMTELTQGGGGSKLLVG